VKTVALIDVSVDTTTIRLTTTAVARPVMRSSRSAAGAFDPASAASPRPRTSPMLTAT